MNNKDETYTLNTQELFSAHFIFENNISCLIEESQAINPEFIYQ